MPPRWRIVEFFQEFFIITPSTEGRAIKEEEEEEQRLM
jgi:hypothetical protein